MEACSFVEMVVLSPVEPPAPGAVAPSFTYHLPDELQGRLTAGSLAVVPFGPRRLYGIVVALSDESPSLRPARSKRWWTPSPSSHQPRLRWPAG